MHDFRHILLIQTAYIGDVILSTAVSEKLHQYYSNARIDFVVRKGLKVVLQESPYVERIIEWDKSKGKYVALRTVIRSVRQRRYDLVINLHRFFSSGLISALAKGHLKVGYKKNPLAFLYDIKVEHDIGNGKHEVERNQAAIEQWTDEQAARPRIYFADQDQHNIAAWQEKPYCTVAPTSVWFTKQFPAEQWVSLLKSLTFQGNIYLLGAPSDIDACENISKQAGFPNVINLCGKLSLRESALLMQQAEMNYVNDSAPMHLASAVNAPTTAIFCSTVPRFGFGPLADDATVVETQQPLPCRPCGLHGFKACPEGHFKCATTIDIKALAKRLD